MNENIRRAIDEKNNQSIVHMADSESIKFSRTDRDVFPYNRWYRGRFGSQYPTIHQRKAGVRKRQDYLYERNDNLFNTYDIYPKHQFQGGSLDALNHHYYASKFDLPYFPIILPP